MNAIVCPNCQYRNPAEALFCTSCGASLAQAAPAAQSAAPRRSNPWIGVSIVLGVLVCLLLASGGGLAIWAFPKLAAPTPVPTPRPTKTPRPTSAPEEVTVIVKTVEVLQTVEVVQVVEVIVTVEVEVTREVPVEVQVIVPATAAPLQPVTLTFWETHLEAEDFFLDELIAEFEQDNPGITVLREHIDDLYDRQVTAAALGNLPDVWRGYFVSDAGVRAATAQFDDLFDQTFFDQFIYESLLSGEIDGHLAGIPETYGGSIMLYYNKDYIDAPPLTFEDLIDQANDLTQTGVQGFATWLEQSYWSAGFLGMSGGWPVDASGNPQFDTPAFISYLEYLKMLQDEGIVPANCDYTCIDSGFANGETAMILNGDWALANYQSSLGETSVGMAAVPPIYGSPFTPLSYGAYYMASAQALEDEATREAVKRFITFMTSADVQRRWLYQYNQMPSRWDVIDDPFIQNDPILAAKKEAMQTARALTNGPRIDCIWTPWQDSLVNTLDGLLTPAEAAAAAQDSVEACIANLP